MPTLAANHEKPVEILLTILIEKLAKREFDLPPLPQIANQVLALTTDPHVDASKLTTVIEQDPILTAKIFQTSNSVVHGSTRQIDSIQQAIAWLGLNTVAGTAFTLSLQAGVFQVRGYEVEVKDLWRHMLTTAYYAKALAEYIEHRPDTAFLSGLLFAIGKPLVVHNVNQYQDNPATLLPWSAIETLIQESYVEMGRQLAETWGFPDSVREAITFHQEHAYHLATSPTKSAPITCLANHLALHSLDSNNLSEDTLRGLSVIQSLKVSNEGINTLLDTYPTIQAQVDRILA